MDMNRRLGMALVAFVIWTAITVIGGNLTTGGNKSLLDAVMSGLGWTWLAAGFILAVVLATFTLGATGQEAASGGLPAEAAIPAGATGLVEFLPVLLVLPNAIYGLWLMRNIDQTHAVPDS